MPVFLLFILVAVVAGSSLAGVVCYYKLAVPQMKPLTTAERELCRTIISKGEGYPFLCRHAVRKGECPCLPCSALEREKNLLIRD